MKLVCFDVDANTETGSVSVYKRYEMYCNRYQASLGAPDTSVEFQRVNSRICVAMMVFAPIYVVQMISSYLRDPENKTGAFGWVKS